MTAGTIVCGVDGSRESDAAIGVASELAQRLGARLVLVHVVERHPVPVAAGPFGGLATSMGTLEDTAVLEAAGERLLAAVGATVDVPEARRRIAVGNPAERLAEAAVEEDASFLVVGSRGHGPLKAAFLGSVSGSLVGLAPCPVVVVPPSAA